jgi:hypothetical protein
MPYAPSGSSSNKYIYVDWQIWKMQLKYVIERRIPSFYKYTDTNVW